MLSPLLACLPLIMVQDGGVPSISETPYDQVLELEITPDDEPAIEGRGPTAVAEYEVLFEGTLHIWTESDLDLFLRVDDASKARPLASDDNSGGGTTPYIARRVLPGDWLVVLVAGGPGATGSLKLHLIATVEHKSGPKAAKFALDVQAAAIALADEGRQSAARELLAEAFPDVIATLSLETPDLLRARSKLARSMYALGDLAGARALEESVLAAYERTLPEGHPDISRARASLAISLNKMGDLARARALREAVVAARERTLPEDHASLLGARVNLANTMSQMGDLVGARALEESVVAAYERSVPEDHPDLLAARINLSTSMTLMGDLAGARAQGESVVVAYERSVPQDHPHLAAARLNLANAMGNMGDLAGARALKETVVATYERRLPEDHPDLLAARSNLANTMFAMGDMAEARSIDESVMAAYERSLPEGHPALLRARSRWATSLMQMGNLTEAYALRMSVLDDCERTLSEDDPDLLDARFKLADSMHVLGDIGGARSLREAGLAIRERNLPADHPDLSAARLGLAESMQDMGDLAGARALYESVLDIYERVLPDDHLKILGVRTNLASAMHRMGDLAGARALRSSVLKTYERILPEDHPDILIARANLASSLDATGDLMGARALDESVVAALGRSLPPDHPDLSIARGNLASTLYALGDLAGAREIDETILASRERTLPRDHPDLLHARGHLAVAMYTTGDEAGARALLPSQIGGMQSRVLASLSLAPRQARQMVASERYRLSEVLSLSHSAGTELEQGVFELTETMRLVAAEAARSLARFEADPELAPMLGRAAQIRRGLNDLVAGTRQDGSGADRLASELTRLSLERDALEREANRRLAERGVVTAPVDLETLTASLAPGDVAVGFRRILPTHLDAGSGESQDLEDHMLAHVVTSEGMLKRVDLGLASELEKLVSEWRGALGAPLAPTVAPEPAIDPSVAMGDKTRGIGISVDADSDAAGGTEAALGHALRAKVLDPVLDQVGTDVTRLFVCADDLLFLLPLDALPIGMANTEAVDGAGPMRIGDRIRIVNEVSFARLLEPASPTAATPSLLVFGGVDHDADGAVPEGLVAASAPIDSTESEGGMESGADELETGDPEGGPISRSAMPGRFQKLVQARYEAEATADIFEEAFEIEGSLLQGKDTTKAALFEAASGKGYLHLATHGWFAPESVRSTEDARPQGQAGSRMGIEDRVTGLAPMTLCGLALAGANNGRDSLGRVPGILTAEELCSLDLSQCELAVLSACETNVGIRRAGQGIQSLQSALYAAGARTSITSLWKVDDAATRRLMEAFYDNLWVQGMGKSDALWQAKQTLRDEGDPPAHWAGWVLTGDPD